MFAHILLGLGIGLAGSFHCIGMCGPLALSLPLNYSNRFKRIAAISLYNLGRSLTYFSLGLLFGVIGSSVSLIGYQQALSIVLGSLILFAVVFGSKLSLHLPLVARVNQRIKTILSRLLLSEKKLHSYLLIGLVNGLLPCGLVYLAIASAIATGTVLGGGFLMLAFGFGTVPLMFGLMVAGRHISLAVRQNMRRLVPVFVGIMAGLMILRGLNLGIPYISPAFGKNAKQEVVGCCSTDSTQENHRH